MRDAIGLSYRPNDVQDLETRYTKREVDKFIKCMKEFQAQNEKLIEIIRDAYTAMKGGEHYFQWGPIGYFMTAIGEKGHTDFLKKILEEKDDE